MGCRDSLSGPHVRDRSFREAKGRPSHHDGPGRYAPHFHAVPGITSYDHTYMCACVCDVIPFVSLLTRRHPLYILPTHAAPPPPPIYYPYSRGAIPPPYIFSLLTWRLPPPPPLYILPIHVAPPPPYTLYIYWCVGVLWAHHGNCIYLFWTPVYTFRCI